jgi:DedD protein
MLRGLRAEKLEPTEERRDKELTLGPAMLLAILSGLLLLCGLFFTLGYRAGRRSAPAAGIAATQTDSGQILTSTGGNSLSKPPAKGLVPAWSSSPPQDVQQTTQPASLDGSATGNALTSYAPAENNTNPATGQPQVRAALPTSPNTPSAASVPGGSYQVQPALPQGAGVMVQIAAVSHIEDANVLMAALRKRGYAVAARRGFSDNLIHVQIGPFASRNDANAISQKLNSDGYNAEVLP